MIVPSTSDHGIHPMAAPGELPPVTSPGALPPLASAPPANTVVMDTVMVPDDAPDTTQGRESYAENSTQIEEMLHTRSAVYCQMCTAAFIGSVVQVTECELLYNNDNTPETLHNVLKIGGSIITLVLLRLIMKYYDMCLEIGKRKKIYNKTETMVSSRLYMWMLFEMALCSVHPIPFLDKEFSIQFKSSLDGDEVDATYTYDSILNIMSLLRLYLLFRAGHYFVGFSTQTDAQMLAVLNDISIGPWFTFRNALHKFPFASISFLLFVLNITSAYALREAERPVQPGFKYYWNSLWCSIMTITTGE
jgi:hypothetical protein